MAAESTDFHLSISMVVLGLLYIVEDSGGERGGSVEIEYLLFVYLVHQLLWLWLKKRIDERWGWSLPIG
jgi:hypothetical protein